MTKAKGKQGQKQDNSNNNTKGLKISEIKRLKFKGIMLKEPNKSERNKNKHQTKNRIQTLKK